MSTNLDNLGFDSISDHEEVETEKPRNEKEETSAISENYKRVTAWKQIVKPNDKTRLGKYSIGKLNGHKKCKDVIKYCISLTSRAQFKMDLDNLTALEFSVAYKMPIMASPEALAALEE